MAKILIADDEPAIRYLVKSFIQMLGSHDVLEVEDGEEAERLLKVEAFDLLLLDFYMPKKNGYELLEDIQQQENRPKIIMLTGKAEQEIDSKYKAHVDRILLKPFQPMDLVALVTEVLGG